MVDRYASNSSESCRVAKLRLVMTKFSSKLRPMFLNPALAVSLRACTKILKLLVEMFVSAKLNPATGLSWSRAMSTASITI